MSDFQAEFSSALLNPDIPTPEGVVNPDGKPATKRFDVYRNNVVHSLVSAMEEAFPVVKKIVGDGFFQAMATQYVRRNPPHDPMIMFYGDRFPEFITGFKPAESLPYLPDVARLELARRECYHAGDARPLDVSALSEIPEDKFASARFTLAPSLRLLDSLYPVHSIWHFNSVAQIKISNPQEWIMLTRPEFDVVPYLLDHATFTFVQCLARYQPLESAIAQCETITDDFDLSAAFGLLFQAGIVTNIET
ncbi:DUF2063 domain-containing protein [Amylibacter marinus]|uniref:DUF2063 domain-containing protein n=1 Tax=Amylibacter marinus TaxID=1475483 RepID=A0ABQ5VRZ0_9RHOB|nr:DNA-binding domain-containing protein [Amylibacter marinus]GLQ34104.1 DUF2063 domain-containing protein [Amylibacter marinus]